MKPEDFAKGFVRPRQYRNRRIGDFFKELEITEGKSTGIPTIKRAMEHNGSPEARFEFDDSYSWFMVTLPIHPVFLSIIDNNTVNVTEKTAKKVDVSRRQGSILSLIENNDRITFDEITSKFTVSRCTIARGIASLKKQEPIFGSVQTKPVLGSSQRKYNNSLPRFSRGISFSLCSSGNPGGLINKLTGRGGSESAVLESLSYCPSVPLARIVKTVKAPNYGGLYNAVSEASEYTLKVY